MLQFWKKIGDNDKNGSTSRTDASIVTVERPLKKIANDNLLETDVYESIKQRSRLCRTLEELLQDKGALGYFLQYLEAKGDANHLLCYLDILTFKSFKAENDTVSISTNSSLTDYTDDGTESAVSIFKKYVAQEAPQGIKCPEELRNEVVENVCDASKITTGDCFGKVQEHCLDTMRDNFNGFVSSDFFSKHQVDILTSGNVALEDILFNETALFYFMEFLEQESCGRLLEFWIAGSNLQQHLENQKEFLDPFEAQTDAVVLYDKYFSLQAHSPLGFSDKIRFDVEQNICGENGIVVDCFQAPLKLVEQILDVNYLKPFLESQLYFKYLSELISTVSNSNLVNCDHSKQLASDCSSERSFNTFLALEINGNIKKRDKADMNIDTRQLSDPDSLWKRRRNHRLSCGRITALGKFETDLEPEPDKSGFKLRNVVRKFINLDEDKRKEEMAWQVAEMIVKDITSVTLHDPPQS